MPLLDPHFLPQLLAYSVVWQLEVSLTITLEE